MLLPAIPPPGNAVIHGVVVFLAIRAYRRSVRFRNSG
jgi:hypothetical protein